MKALLEAPELKLLASKDFKTAYWESFDGPVKVQIYAGISEQEKTNGGWYIFCNKRLVLGPDNTKVTGWGAHDPVTVPEYHSQFYRFQGLCFFRCRGSAKSPLEHHEDRHGFGFSYISGYFAEDDSINAFCTRFSRSIAPRSARLRKGDNYRNTFAKCDKSFKDRSLSDEVRQNPAYRSPEKFVAPERAKPVRPVVKQTIIRYAVLTSKYDLAKEYFDADKPNDVGLGTFNYFFEREIGE